MGLTNRIHRLGLAVTLMCAAGTASAVDFTSLLTSWIGGFNQEMSAMRVLTKQRSVVGDMLATASLQTSSAAATTIAADLQATLVRGAAQRFGTDNQGVFPCFQNDVSLNMGNARMKTGVASQRTAATIAGLDYGSDSARGGAQISLHKGVYCSVSEHKMGACKLNTAGLQSADSDFSMLAKGGTKSTSERAAGYDYVDNILPQRRTTACPAGDCQAQAADTRVLNAVDSLARLSFVSMIEARAQQTTTPTQ